ncbi:thiol:disulfide interchange protein dsbE [Asticcacaulis biprosthecium C19]|uniref:Thiol:disulfide interchange protein dsbE n=1 Tax=Asticcacaulis biprosthecium C19 TaxID=715226 RepID=F4QKJ6_9CAUL|nr:DsbE family thiol:disulfide interchange protein [Asticcacaulis biprosthecium]EGF92148.1 thiol:disulfide interchange protein dsbE [Asticcacaulis biprosthecium C19]
MKRLFALIPLVVFAGLLAVLGYYNFHKKQRYTPDAMVGKSVPALAIADLDTGGEADLKTLVAGYDKPVLVNVFASWCTPCVAENPTLIALKQKGVVIIGVAWKDEPQNTLKFLAEHDNPYVRTLSDPDGRLAMELGVSGVPETYVVQPDGKITFKIADAILPQTVGDVEAALGVK